MNFCPKCSAALTPEMNFCPQCGRKSKEAPPSTTPGTQTVVYLISFFLPPLGLWYVPRYFKYGGATEKKIGWAIIILTVISMGITLWAAEAIINSVNQSLQSLSF